MGVVPPAGAAPTVRLRSKTSFDSLDSDACVTPPVKKAKSPKTESDSKSEFLG